MLAHLEQDLDGFLGAAFVEIETGRSIAAHSVQLSFDQASVIDAGRIAIEAYRSLPESSENPEHLEDIIVTRGSRIHLYQLVSPTVFLSVSADRAETNLALLKATTRRRIEALPPQNEAAMDQTLEQTA